MFVLNTKIGTGGGVWLKKKGLIEIINFLYVAVEDVVGGKSLEHEENIKHAIEDYVRACVWG